MKKTILLLVLSTILVSCHNNKSIQTSLPVQSDSITVTIVDTIIPNSPIEVTTDKLYQYKNIQLSIPENWSIFKNDSDLSIMKDPLTKFTIKVNDFHNSIELNNYYEKRMEELSSFQPDGVCDNSAYEITYLNDDTYYYQYCIWNEVDVVSIDFSCPIDDYDSNNEIIYNFISSVKL